MAFLAEDGTGLEASNSYIAVALADTHHTDRANTQWDDMTTAEKEAALIRATDYIEKRFGRKFVGRRTNKTQALEWPRVDAEDRDGFLLSGIDVDAIPRQLQKATAEYALRAFIYNVLSPDVPPAVPSQDLRTGGTRGTQEASGSIVKERIKVDVIEEEKEYRSLSSFGEGNITIKSSLVSDAAIPEYPEADMWIQELLKSATVVRLERA